jgi:soluble lytic murein transglycosylase-like protein
MRSRENPFEALFAEQAGSIPVGFLTALALHESGFDPNAVNPKSKATGLFQITQVALDAYNGRHKTTHALDELKDPALSTKVAVDHIGRILLAYARHPALQIDWQSRRFLELLVYGWNAGHNGVAGLVGKLEAGGLPAERITVETVRQLAAKTSRSPYLASPSRAAWARAVATSYLGESGEPSSPAVASVASMASAAVFLVGVGAIGLAAWLSEKARR